jgi:hypothetical protein
MKLKSFGCSFIFGTDLCDIAHSTHQALPSKLTWPALVAQRLELEYCCYARPGAGNLRIAENVLAHAASGEHDLFVIGWTWIDRFDYTDTEDRWHTLLPNDTGSVARTYYRDLHSQYRDKLTNLIIMRDTVSVLEKHGIPYVMTCMDELIMEQKWHATTAVTQAQDFLGARLSDFDGTNFLGWSERQGFDISATMHPLEQAHRAAADLMLASCQARL